ncbi:hypothetical protein [Nonomuraea sp. NPDC002799]
MRLLIAATVALVTAVPAVAHAESAGPDPIRAIRTLLAEGSGARIDVFGSVVTSRYKRDEASDQDHTGGYDVSGAGRIRLGASGVVAAEVTRKLTFEGAPERALMAEDAETDPYAAGVLASAGTTRMISVRGRQYQLPPKAKRWIGLGRASGGAAAYGDQVINVFEPATLRKLLAGADRKSVSDWHENSATGRRQRIYTVSGLITLAGLHTLSPSFREAAGPATGGAAQVDWTYMYDDRGLPYRAGWLFHALPDGEGLGDDRVRRVSMATQYRGWGSEVSITAPRSVRGKGLAVDEVLDVLRAPARSE